MFSAEGAVYLAAGLGLVRNKNGGIVLGPAGWAVAGAGLLLGVVGGRRWALYAGGAVAALGAYWQLTAPAAPARVVLAA
jgi:hypothetical protein